MPTANIISLVVTDDSSSDHSDNPSAAPIHVPVPDHSRQAGFVVGMVLAAVIVAAAILPW